jgi:hypothetical protein
LEPKHVAVARFSVSICGVFDGYLTGSLIMKIISSENLLSYVCVCVCARAFLHLCASRCLKFALNDSDSLVTPLNVTHIINSFYILLNVS